MLIVVNILNPYENDDEQEIFLLEIKDFIKSRFPYAKIEVGCWAETETWCPSTIVAHVYSRWTQEEDNENLEITNRGELGENDRKNLHNEPFDMNMEKEIEKVVGGYLCFYYDVMDEVRNQDPFESIK